MQICPNCGEENPERFRLCGFCGSELTPAVRGPETRKTVTIVFSDLKGSTDIGERLDPESIRELMSRYFEQMKAVLEGHGGSVEKYIGDAIMAVFGLPVVREDDALRAVRAAADMRRALDNPFVAASGMVQPVDHPGKAGLRVLTLPVKVDGERPRPVAGERLKK